MNELVHHLLTIGQYVGLALLMLVFAVLATVLFAVNYQRSHPPQPGGFRLGSDLRRYRGGIR